MPNISRNKGNQTMTLSQFIENNNMTNIFLEKSYTKYGGETSPRPFSEKSELSINLDQQSAIWLVLFLEILGNMYIVIIYFPLCVTP